MSRAAQSLTGSLVWHLIVPRGGALLIWWGLNQLVQLPPALLWGLIAVDALLLLWAARAHLHSADAHMRGSGAMAPVWGGYLVLLFFILASVVLWWQAILVAHRPAEGLSYAEQRNLARAAQYSLTLSEDETSLHFDGTVTFGLTKRLKALLEQHPELQKLQLSSPGGLIYEARGAASLLQAHNIETEALGLCASACTLIFVAGESRRLAAGARLGFHGYALEHFGSLPQIDLAKEQAKDRASLLRQGISADFIDRIFATAPSDLWQPSKKRLAAAGVLAPKP